MLTLLTKAKVLRQQTSNDCFTSKDSAVYKYERLVCRVKPKYQLAVNTQTLLVDFYFGKFRKMNVTVRKHQMALHRKWCCFGQTEETLVAHSVLGYIKLFANEMDKLKKALSGDDEDEEAGIVTQVKFKSFQALFGFILISDI